MKKKRRSMFYSCCWCFWYWLITIIIIYNILAASLIQSSEANSMMTTMTTTASSMKKRSNIGGGSNNNHLCSLCGSDTFACGNTIITRMPPITTTKTTIKNQKKSNDDSVVAAAVDYDDQDEEEELPARTWNQNQQDGDIKTKQHHQQDLTRIKARKRQQQQYSSSSNNCTCIPLSWQCDGEADCSDSSDEIGCEKPICSKSKEFVCATQAKCIKKEHFCNGIDDCGDNSDELDCEPRECNIEIETRCDNGRCIPSEWLCDNYDDCGDLSDERCIDPICTTDEFRCHSDGQCIPLLDHCNNVTDCQDLSDEIDCVVQQHQHHYQNKSHATVSSSSSLYPMMTSTLATAITFSSSNNSQQQNIQCPVNQIMCLNGLCISELYHCDNDNDCGDWSDEQDCDGHMKCRVTEYLCRNGQCINQDWRCDGDFDCEDLSDEISCPSQSCSKQEFRCRSGKCIRGSWRCDGDKDCLDNSDEDGCSNQHLECSIGNFRCRDGTCINLSNVCDGAPNCPDGSDEDTNSTCIANLVPCRESGFPCQHLCVATTNGHFCTCKKGYRKASDGRSCIDIDECVVGDLRSEYLEQYTNYRSPTSIDVQQKQQPQQKKELTTPNIQVCSQICQNSVPGYQCSCVEGYILRVDGRRCKAIQTLPEPILLISNLNTNLRALILDSTTLVNTLLPFNYNLESNSSPQPNVFNNNNDFDSFDNYHSSTMIYTDYHFKENLYFWINTKTRTIYSALLELNSKDLILISNNSQQHQQYSTSNGKKQSFLSLSNIKLKNVKPIVEIGLQEPSDLTVDWINNRLFWTDSGRSRIEHSNLDGTYRKILFGKNSVQRPKSIVIDPQHSILYWSDWGQPIRIDSSFEDGSNKHTIISSLMMNPASLTIDYPAKKLYWTDTKQNLIECSNLDGSNRYTILHTANIHPITTTKIQYPISLTIFEDNLYWTGLNQPQQINIVNKLTGKLITSVDIQQQQQKLKELEELAKDNPPNDHRHQHRKHQTKVETKISSAFIASNIDVKIYHSLRQPEQADHHQHHCKTSQCSHICLPNNISYRCSCPFGFSFEDDDDDYTKQQEVGNKYHYLRKTRKSQCKKDSDSLLLFSHRNEIRAINLSKRKSMVEQNINNMIHIASDYDDFNLDHVLPINHIQFIVSMDYDPQTHIIYWVDLLNKSISRSSWNGDHTSSIGERPEVLINSSLDAPSSIAYDWLGRNIYWIDTGRNVIEVCHQNGSFRSIVVWRGLDQPRDIVLDPHNALMFWSQWNNHTNGQIERSGMDGSARMKIHSTNLSRPHGLAIDYSSRRIYWTDSAQAQIEYSFYDGSNRRQVFADNLRQPFSIAIRNEFLYWSDLQLRNIQQANKITGQINSILVENLDNLMDLMVFQYNSSAQQQRQSSFNNSSNNIFRMGNLKSNNKNNNNNVCDRSKCSHLCVLSPNQPGYSCLCPIGIKLLSNNFTCADDMNKYLIMTTRSEIKRISFDTDYHLDVKIPIKQKLSNAFALDVHFETNSVYWSDTNENTIFRTSILHGGKIEKVIDYGLNGVNGLAIDNVGNKIYWTDAGKKRLEVSNLDGSSRKVLISKDLNSPRGIALNPRSGHMIWCDWGSLVRIERADMDGRKRALIVDQDLGWPNGITFTKNGRIIWADSKTHTIEMVDLNGTNRRIIIKDLLSPYGITIMDDYLYWTDWQTKSVYRIPFSADFESDISIAQSFQIRPEIFSKSLNNLVDIVAVDKTNEINNLPSKDTTSNICPFGRNNSRICSHLCLLNSLPGYSCHCPTGIALLNDQINCKTKIDQQLLLAYRNGFRQLSLDTDDWIGIDLPILPQQFVDIVAFDIQYKLGKIFYIDNSYKQIRSFEVPGGKNLSQLIISNSDNNEKSNFFNESIIVSDGLKLPTSLVVDWVANNIYWSDQERHLIEVSRLDGSSRKILIDLDLNNPRCLQIMPNFGYLFWVNNGIDDETQNDNLEYHNYHQKIERSFLDGSSRFTLIDQNPIQINDLIVDDNHNHHEAARIYWTDSHSKTIESIQIDGTNRKRIISSGLIMPFSLTILDDYIYWSDMYHKVIERANRWTGMDYQLINDDDVENLRQIRSISSTRQTIENNNNNKINDNYHTNDNNDESASAENPNLLTTITTVSNPCAIQNGDCSHLCLFRPHGYICACPLITERPCSTVPGEFPQNHRSTSSFRLFNIKNEPSDGNGGSDDKNKDRIMIIANSSTQKINSNDYNSNNFDLNNVEDEEEYEFETKIRINENTPLNRKNNSVLESKNNNSSTCLYFSDKNNTSDNNKNCITSKFDLISEDFFQTACKFILIIFFLVILLAICILICKRKLNQKPKSLDTKKNQPDIVSQQCNLDDRNFVPPTPPPPPQSRNYGELLSPLFYEEYANVGNHLMMTGPLVHYSNKKMIDRPQSRSRSPFIYIGGEDGPQNNYNIQRATHNQFNRHHTQQQSKSINFR